MMCNLAYELGPDTNQRAARMAMMIAAVRAATRSAPRGLCCPRVVRPCKSAQGSAHACPP